MKPVDTPPLAPRGGKTRTTGNVPSAIFPEVFLKEKETGRTDYRQRTEILQTIKLMQSHLPVGSAEGVHSLAPRFFASVTGKYPRFWAAFRKHLQRPLCIRSLPPGDFPKEGIVAEVGNLESTHWIKAAEPHWAAVIEGNGALSMEDALVAIAKFDNFLADAWDEIYSDQLEGKV